MRRSPDLLFLYDLAHALGKSVAEIETTMSAAELAGWVAWSKIRSKR